MSDSSTITKGRGKRIQDLSDDGEPVMFPMDEDLDSGFVQSEPQQMVSLPNTNRFPDQATSRIGTNNTPTSHLTESPTDKEDDQAKEDFGNDADDEGDGTSKFPWRKSSASDRKKIPNPFKKKKKTTDRNEASDTAVPGSIPIPGTQQDADDDSNTWGSEELLNILEELLLAEEM